jgi:hypothetical protein
MYERNASLRPQESSFTEGHTDLLLGRSALRYQPGMSLAELGGTFVRASTATYFDINGVLQTAAGGQLRDAHYIGGVRTTLIEGTRTNVVPFNRDLTNAAHTKTNVTPAKDQTGIDGVANSCSRITASAVNGTCLAAVVDASKARVQYAYVKRLVGAGGIDMTMDGGTTWTAIAPGAGVFAKVTIPSQTLANPSIGFRIQVNGDSIAVDYIQNEGLSAGSGVYGSSPILTAGGAVNRPDDALIFVLPVALRVPRPLTLYGRAYNLGIAADAASIIRFLELGTGTGRFFIRAGDATHAFASLNVNAGGTSLALTSATVPVLNDVVECAAFLNELGMATAPRLSVNGAAESIGAPGTAVGLSNPWGSLVLGVGNEAGASVGFAAFTDIKIALQNRTIAEMRNL